MTTIVQNMRGVRRAARHVALTGLSAWDRCSFRAEPSANRVHILLLHHVFADEVGAFRRLLESLREAYAFVAYSDAVSRILENRIDGAYLAISFDDGLKCCRQAAEVLDEFGARACFLICPPIVGETDAHIVARFCRERLRHPPLEFLDWNDIDELLDRGHEIGGHTMRHINLNQTELTAAQDEIAETHVDLCARIGAATHFAWPYGRFADMNRAAARAVFAAGFHSCASGVRGCHGPSSLQAASEPFDQRQLCLRRESIEVAWPLSHVNYFLRKSARRPLTVGETWPAALQPVPLPDSNIPCTLPSTRSPSSRAAA